MAQTDSKKRMKELVDRLNLASEMYYQKNNEIMSNYEYDALYDELSALEKETGVILSGSPTQRVGYEILSELPKEVHPSPMLSLDKTKEVDTLGCLACRPDRLAFVENGRPYCCIDLR